MREVLKTLVPRTHWAATNVDLVPTIAHGAQLARWGGVGVFGAFWMIGTTLYDVRDLRVVFCVSRVISSSSSSSSSNSSLSNDGGVYNANSSFFLTILTGDNAFAWAKSFVVNPPDEN